MPTKINYKFSVEEFAFILAHSGALEAGQGYLQAMLTLDDLAPERFNDWMTVASHSLIARGDLSLDSSGNYGDLAPDLQSLAQAVARDQCTLRCQRAHQNTEQFISFLFDDDLLLAHWLEQRVATVIEVIADKPAVFERVAAFAGIAGDHPLASDEQMTGRLTINVLSELRKVASKHQLQPMTELLQRHMSSENTKLIGALAETLIQPDTLWGSVLRVERANNDSDVIAERGFVFVAAPGSPWLLPLDAGDRDFVRVMPGTQAGVAELCKQLIRPN